MQTVGFRAFTPAGPARFCRADRSLASSRSDTIFASLGPSRSPPPPRMAPELLERSPNLGREQKGCSSGVCRHTGRPAQSADATVTPHSPNARKCDAHGSRATYRPWAASAWTASQAGVVVRRRPLSLPTHPASFSTDPRELRSSRAKRSRVPKRKRSER
jgi:hypothetical protein